MNDGKQFQRRLQKVGELVHELEAIADPSSRTAAKQLMQLLMDLHGSALERMLEIAFETGDHGARLIDEFAKDPLVSSLLILYGLHPDPLQTRVERKLEQIRSSLFKLGAETTLISASDGGIRVRVTLNNHTCGSTANTVRATVEEAIYEAAPDLTSLSIDGLESPAASGFVGLEKLIASSDSSAHSAERSEGMD